jgi:voltage-gated potassium channel
MTVVTVTTVGYAEVLDGMHLVPYARAFTVVLLVFGTGILVFFASTITAFIIDGNLRDMLFASRMKKRMRRMQDHIIVCGAGSTGRNVIDELLAAGIPVIAIDLEERELREFTDKYPKVAFSYLIGDATDDDVIAQANLAGARGLVAALSSDKDNLYLTVSARQLAPKARIVARCAELSHVEKIRRAGADAVVSPNFIGVWSRRSCAPRWCASSTTCCATSNRTGSRRSSSATAAISAPRCATRGSANGSG